MALQHFYSRVPARMSVFNRNDSFDTFAFSAGMEREFIEKELAPVYENKPSKNDASLIRMGKLMPVYCQYFTKTGKFVQSCTNYLPLDYTGERSAPFAHTLIPNEAEEKELLSNPDNLPLNPEMFKNDLSEFDLTGEKAQPITDYPEIEYKPKKSDGTAELLKYDSAMMKRLIFAMLNLACGKGKNIFVSLPYKMDCFSEKALEFIGTLLQIFPYHIRRAFSFVTYTDDATRYNGFNLRFIPEGAAEIPLAKGMTLHFGSKIAIGLSDEMVVNNSQIVEFFYNLLKNDDLRRQFLQFIEDAVQVEPNLKKANLKAMTELVFLFQQASGMYSEKTILPNDGKVYEYICAYDKHRAALSTEHRAKALTCLNRYYVNHTMIPKEIFSKVNKIYPTEPKESKKVIMEIVLEMIHTDLMREKLFAFIKSNYASEEKEQQSEITLNLCRVYYGGFLQMQILNFFDEIFGDESEQAKNSIIEKLLLTVRTPAIRGKIFEIFDKVYDTLQEAQKQKLFEAFYEILPEADEPAVEFAALIDKHIENESVETKADLSKHLLKAVLEDEKTENPRLLKQLFRTTGFCASSVGGNILLSLSDKDIFSRFASELKAMETHADKIKLVNNIWDFAPDITPDIAKKWGEKLCEIQSGAPSPFGLFDLIEYDKTLSAYSGEAKEIFAKTVLCGYIRPVLCSTLPKILAAKLKPETFNSVIDYVCDKDYITNSPQYLPVAAYVKLYNAAKQNAYADMADAAPVLTEKTIKAGVAEHIKANILSAKGFEGDEFEFTKILTKFLLSFIDSGELNFFDSYTDGVASLSEKMFATDTESKRETVEAECAKKSIGYTVKIAELVYSSPAFGEQKAKVFEDNGSLYISLSEFSAKTKRFDKVIEEISAKENYGTEYCEKLNEITQKIQKSGGFLKKLFKK